MPIGKQELTDITVEQAETVPGMAHFAGTGPKGKYCNDCVFLTPEKLQLYCEEYKRIMGKRKYGLHGGLRSCKYFNEKKQK